MKYKNDGIENQRYSLFKKDFKNKIEFKTKLEGLIDKEFTETFHDILNLPKSHFFESISDRVKNALSEIYSSEIYDNELLMTLLNSYINNLETKYNMYFTELNNGWKKYEKEKNNKNIYLTYFRKHCAKTKNYAIHNCNQKGRTGKFISIYVKNSLRIYKRKSSNDSTSILKNNYNDIKYVICESCKKSYLSSIFLNYCSNCEINYYSSILENDENPDLLPATWENYHCPPIVNEKMRCIKCRETFYIDLKTDNLKCINPNCNFITKPKNIEWKCSQCSEKFKSGILVYNPLEKIHIIDEVNQAILIKKRAHPLSIPCCKNIDIVFTEFYHRKFCKGVLYFGDFKKRKIVVCGKCKAVNYLEKFLWTCPNCGKNFTNENIDSQKMTGLLHCGYDMFKQKKSNLLRGKNKFVLNKIDEDNNNSNSTNDSGKKTKNLSNSKNKNNKNIYSENIDKIFTESNKKFSPNESQTISKSSNMKYIQRNIRCYYKEKENKNKRFFNIQNQSKSLSKEKNKEKEKQTIGAINPNSCGKKRFFNLNKPKIFDKDTNKKKEIDYNNPILNSTKRYLHNNYNSCNEDIKIKIEDKKTSKFLFYKKKRMFSPYVKMNLQNNFEAAIKEKENINDKNLKNDNEQILNKLYKNNSSKQLLLDKNAQSPNPIKIQTEFSDDENDIHEKNKNEKKKNEIIPYKRQRYHYRINKENNNIKENNYINKNNEKSNIYEKKYIFEKNNIENDEEIKRKKKEERENQLMEKIKNYKVYRRSKEEEDERQKLQEEIEIAKKEMLNNRPNNLIYLKNNPDIKIDIPLDDPHLKKCPELRVRIESKIRNIISHSHLPLFDLADYEINKKIGEGSYGVIFEVTNINNKKKYAMKKIIANDLKQLEKFKTEFEIICQNTHPNILDIYAMNIKCYDVTTFALCVLMELAESDWDIAITEHFKAHKNYTEQELISILKQLTGALVYLQRDVKIAHRDIKPDNILIFNNNIYKLSDFGEAKETKLYKKMNTLKGTDIYMSPILYNSLKKDMDDVQHNMYKSDVFSLGYCFLYAASLNYDIINEIRDLDDPEKIRVILYRRMKNRYSIDFIEVILQMININEENRIDFIGLDKLVKNSL